MTEKVRRFLVKLNPDAKPDQLIKITGVIEVFTAFPEDSSDPDMSLVYYVDAVSDHATDVFTSLSIHPDVEYAELPANRKLV